MARKFKTPITIDELGSASSQALAANVDGDSQNRINIDAGGKITWGSGSATGDTTLYRSAADTLKTDDAFTATSLAVTGQFTFPTSDGSADQVITTNGSGTLTWSDVSANATVSDTAPSSPVTGQIWYESDTGRTFVYYDSFWVEVGASPPASPFITDLDEDTKIQVEESADEDKIRFDTAGSERMIIDSSGNVGIGTTTPRTPLEIQGTSSGSVDEVLLLAADGNQVAGSGARLHLSGGNATQRSAYVEGVNTGGATNAHALTFGTSAGSSNPVERMRIDPSGNVGIGTTSPAYKLDVAGDIHISNAAPFLIFTDTDTNAESRISANSGVGSLIIDADYNNEQAGTNIVFKSDGAERMRIDSSGNVGIGTTSPDAPLEVADATNAVVYLNDTGGTQGSSLNAKIWFQGSGTNSGVVGFNNTGSGILTFSNEDGPVYVQTKSSHDILFRTQETTRMTVDSSGNIGIGTSSPPEKLTVDNGIIHSRSGFSGPTTPPTDKGVALTAVGMNTSSKYTPGILFGSRDPQFTTTNPKYNAGIYGVATETYGNDSDTAMQIEFLTSGTNGGTGHGIGLGTGYRMGPVSFYPLIDNTCDLGGSSSNLRWDDIFATSGTVNTSDQRDKANITNLDLGLSFVDSLRPVSYTWADRSGYVGSRTHMGFVAQEVATALGDEAVNRGLWINSPSVPIDPEDPEGEQTDERQGLRYHQLIAPMVKAIQELSATVQTLTDRIEALEAE